MKLWKEYKDFLRTLCWPIEIIWIFIRELFKGEITKETRRIVILGKKWSGKTELWCRLRGIKNQEKGGTSEEPIEMFELGRKEDGTPVIVLATKDIGGGDQWVSDYDNLINEDGTYVFYLINLDRFEKEKKENQLRLTRIASIIKKKKFEKCGLRLVATFYDTCGKSKNEAIADVQSMLREIKMIKKTSEIPVEVINTTNDNDVKIIKKEILKSLES